MSLEVKKSRIPKAGKGLFAKEIFKRNDKIIEYTGEIITWKDCQKRNEALDGVGLYYFYVSDKKCIDAQNVPESMARYANDAAGFVRLPGFRNNARFEVIKSKPYIIASKTIKAGDEIYVAYGKEYWDAMRINGFDPNMKKTKKAAKKKEKLTVSKREPKH